MRSFAFLTFISALVSCVSALPQPARPHNPRDSKLPRTNAERLRRGLPLKPPVRRWISPAASPSASSTSSSQAGFVAVFSSDVRIGYLQCGETCRIIPNDESYYATAVRFTSNSQGTPFDIVYDGASNPNMGGFVQAFSGNLGEHRAAEARLQSVVTTNAGVHPSDTFSAFTESAIWTYAPSNGVLTPTWIDSKNNDITTLIMADDKGNLFLSGDATKFEAKHGTQVSGPLTLQFTAASPVARSRSSQ